MAKRTMQEVMNREMDVLEPPYHKDDKAYDEYVKAKEILERLQQQGKCRFKADSELIALYLHAIQIWWNIEDDTLEIPAREIADVLKDMRVLILDPTDKTEWHITKQIYFPD